MFSKSWVAILSSNKSSFFFRPKPRKHLLFLIFFTLLYEYRMLNMLITPQYLLNDNLTNSSWNKQFSSVLFALGQKWKTFLLSSLKSEVKLKVGIESIQAHHVNIIQLDNNFKVSNYSNIGNSAQLATRSQTTNWPCLSYPILSDRQYDSGRKVGRCSSLYFVHLQDSVSVVLRTKGKRSASSTHGIFQRRCRIRYCKYIHFLLRFPVTVINWY